MIRLRAALATADKRMTNDERMIRLRAALATADKRMTESEPRRCRRLVGRGVMREEVFDPEIPGDCLDGAGVIVHLRRVHRGATVEESI